MCVYERAVMLTLSSEKFVEASFLLPCESQVVRVGSKCLNLLSHIYLIFKIVSQVALVGLEMTLNS